MTKQMSVFRRENKGLSSTTIIIIVTLLISLPLVTALVKRRTTTQQKAFYRKEINRKKINLPSLAPSPSYFHPTTSSVSVGDLYQKIGERIRGGQERTGEAISVETCEAMFWNIVPPPVPVKQAKMETEAALIQVKQRVLAGEQMESVCSEVLDRQHNSGKTYINGNYQERNGNRELPIFNLQNQHLEDVVWQMSKGAVEVYPLYDGGYVMDDITENDSDYIAGYLVVKKVF